MRISGVSDTRTDEEKKEDQVRDEWTFVPPETLSPKVPPQEEAVEPQRDTSAPFTRNESGLLAPTPDTPAQQPEERFSIPSDIQQDVQPGLYPSLEQIRSAPEELPPETYQDIKDPVFVYSRKKMVEAIEQIGKYSQNPEEDSDKMVVSAWLAGQMELDPVYVYKNYDHFSASFFGKDNRLPMNNRQAIGSWFQSGVHFRNTSLLAMDLHKDIMAGRDFSESLRKLEELQAQAPEIDTLRRSLPIRLLQKTAQALPYMGDIMAVGAATQGAMSLIALIAPQLALPAWVTKVAVMVAAGYRSSELQIGAAMMDFFFMEDKDGNRIDPRMAALASMAVGIPQALIESTQVMNFLPGKSALTGKVLDAAFKKAAFGKTISGIILKYIGKYGAMAFEEGAEEFVQEVIGIIGKNVVSEMANQQGADFDKVGFEEAVTQSLQAFKDGAAVSMVLGLPKNFLGLAGETGLAIQEQNKQLSEADKLKAEQEEIASRAGADGNIIIPDRGDRTRYQEIEEETAELDTKIEEARVKLESAEGESRGAAQDELTELEEQKKVLDEEKGFLSGILAKQEHELTHDEWEYIRRQGHIQDVRKNELTRQRLKEQVSEWMPNLSEEQQEGAAVLLDLRAEALGISTDEYLQRYHENEVFTTDDRVQAAQGKKGGVSFREIENDAKALIYVTKNSDFSTWVHENAHIFRRQLEGDLLSKAEAALGVDKDGWTVAKEEEFARGFEQFLMNGEAPTPELKNIFQKFAEWLQNIYTKLKGTVDINPDIREVYGRLLGKSTEGQGSVEKPVGVQPKAVQVEKSRGLEQPTATMEGIESREVPIDEISLSEDVPNFKEGADESGVVEPLDAERYERLGTAPIVLWERSDGRKEVITGRHRLDLARRTGEKSIPAQIVKESDGFTKEQAMTFDAEANIRDGQGSVSDYVNYFRNTDVTREEASRRGLLARDKGRTGFAIGKYAADPLYTLYRNGEIGDKKAAAIAEAAPNNEMVQDLGIKKMRSLKVEELFNYLRVVQMIKPEAAVQQLDMFGNDDSAIIEAEKVAREATSKLNEMRVEASALKTALKLGAEKSKKYTLLKKYGFKAGDTKAITKRLDNLLADIEAWENWTTDPDKYYELRKMAGLEVKEAVAEEQAEVFEDTETPLLFQEDEDYLRDEDIYNPIDRTATQEKKAWQLRKLADENQPFIDEIIQEIDKERGTSSKSSYKKIENIITKANRPSILKEKPWFDVEYVRDSFRFKTVINSFDDIIPAVQKFIDQGIEIIKLDTKKMLNPKEWGWRFVAFDLRFPNGQLVEYYMPLKEQEAAKKAGNHALFEKWRNTEEQERIEKKAEYFKDLQESNNRYQEAWETALARLGLDESAAEASWKNVEASLLSLTRSKLSLRSSAEIDPSLQEPSSKTAEISGESTKTRSESGSLETKKSDITSSTTNITQPEAESKKVNNNILFQTITVEPEESTAMDELLSGAETTLQEYLEESKSGKDSGFYRHLIRGAERRLERTRGIVEHLKAGENLFEKPESSRGQFSIVHPASREGGKWQLSHFDRQGPYGHEVFNTLSGAAKYLAQWNEWVPVKKEVGMEGGSFILFQEDISPEEARAQLEVVRRQYEGTDAWMKAPNGNDTNLTERQWLQVRTPVFKQWFGDWEADPDNASKVVDENDEPMVVYHGSSEKFDIFTSWIPAFFAPSREYAEGFVGVKGRRKALYKVFLSIKNPSTEINYTKAERFFSEQRKKERAGSAFYDGIYVDEGNGEKSIIPLHSNQIKSATENRGTFNPNDPSILFQEDVKVTDDQEKTFAKSLKNKDKNRAYRILYDVLGIEFVDSSIDRGGMHSPAGPGYGAPMWDVSNDMYPDDVYTSKGLSYYGTGEESMDRQAWNQIMSLKGKPNADVKIYRAVESGYKGKLNPGDWVTTIRAYAKDHGESALGGDYRIISKTVKARDIYTAGDSWLEWGYHPQDILPTIRAKKDVDGNVYFESLQYYVDQYYERVAENGGNTSTINHILFQESTGDSSLDAEYHDAIQKAVAAGKLVPRDVLEQFRGESWANDALEEIRRKDVSMQVADYPELASDARMFGSYSEFRTYVQDMYQGEEAEGITGETTGMTEEETDTWYRRFWEEATEYDYEKATKAWATETIENIEPLLKDLHAERKEARGMGFHSKIWQAASYIGRKVGVPDDLLSSVKNIIQENADKYRELIARFRGDQAELERIQQEKIRAEEKKAEKAEERRLRDLDAKERIEIAEMLEDPELQRRILSGDITLKEIEDDYTATREDLRDLARKNRKLEKELGTYRDWTAKAEEILEEQLDIWKEAAGRIKELDAEIKQRRSEGKVIPADYKEERKQAVADRKKAEEEMVRILQETAKEAETEAGETATDIAEYYRQIIADIKDLIKGQEEIIESARREARMQRRVIVEEARTAERKKLQKQYAERKARALAKKKLREYKLKLARKITRKVSKGTDWYYRIAIEEIQSVIDPNFRSNKTLRNKEKSQEFFRQNPEAVSILSDKVKKKIFSKPLNDYTLEELEDIAGRVEQMRNLGRKKYVLKEGVKKAHVVNMATDATHDALGGDELKTIRGRGSKEAQEAEKTGFWKKVQFATLRPNRVLQILAGGEKGVLYEFLWHLVNELQDEELHMIDYRMKPAEEKMKELGIMPKNLAEEITYTLETGEEITYSRGELIGFYVYQKNERSRKAITHGEKLLDSEVEGLIALLTKEEKAWGDFMLADFAEHTERLYKTVVDVENIPFILEEFYFTMCRQDLDQPYMKGDLAADMAMREAFKKGYASDKFRETRLDIKAENQAKIRLDVTNIWMQQVVKQEHYMAFAQHVKDAQRVVWNRTLREALRQQFGQEANDWLEKYVNDIANPTIYQSITSVEKASRLLRSHTAMSYLAFNVATILKQAPSIAFYLAEAGPFAILQAAGQMMFQPGKTLKFVNEHDPQMKARSVDRFTEELRMLDRNGYERFVRAVGNTGMKGIMAMDKLATTIGWKAVYDKNIRAGKTEEEAMWAAQEATLRTQPAARAKDVAEIYRSSEALNWFTQFTNQLNQIWNIASYDVPNAFRHGRTMYAMANITSMVISAVVIGMISAPPPEDDEKLERYGDDLLKNMMSSVPLIGKGIVSGYEGWYGSGTDPFPLAEAVGGAMRLMTSDSKNVEWRMKALAQGLSVAMGLPYTGAKRVVTAIAEQRPSALLGWREEDMPKKKPEGFPSGGAGAAGDF